MPIDERTQKLRYVREVGHEPRNLPEDHPGLWQWLYKGTPQDRQMLLEQLGIPEEPTHEDQEVLF